MLNRIKLFENFLIKESINDEVMSYFYNLMDDGFIVNIEDDKIGGSENSKFIRIWYPINSTQTNYFYSNTKSFDWSEIEDDVVRAVHFMINDTNIPIKMMYSLSGDKTNRMIIGEREVWSTSDILQRKPQLGEIISFLIFIG